MKAHRLLLLVLVAALSSSAAEAGSQPASRCTAEATEALIRGFVANYNARRVLALDRVWAREPYFQWFSSSPPGARLGPQARDRTTLTGYFRARVRVHERIRITELHAGYDPARNIVNFNGYLVRRADDLHTAADPQPFKGAAGCISARPLLIVWSM